jgi:molybdopterin-binding protein
MRLSARNRIIGKVEEIYLGDIMAHIVVRAGEVIIESVITRRSADEMNHQVYGSDFGKSLAAPALPAVSPARATN